MAVPEISSLRQPTVKPLRMIDEYTVVLLLMSVQDGRSNSAQGRWQQPVELRGALATMLPREHSFIEDEFGLGETDQDDKITSTTFPRLRRLPVDSMRHLRARALRHLTRPGRAEHMIALADRLGVPSSRTPAVS